MVKADKPLRFDLGLTQDRQQLYCEDGDNGDYDEQLDEREADPPRALRISGRVHTSTTEAVARSDKAD
jgi:hypothetical protein